MAVANRVCGAALQRHVSELLGYPERNERALVHYAAQRRCGEPISTAFVESAVNEIVVKRMNKKQQMRWNRVMRVQPFLDQLEGHASWSGRIQTRYRGNQ